MFVETIGGKRVGQVFEGQRRFPLQGRFQPSDRTDIDRIKQLKVTDSLGRPIPLSQWVDIRVEDGPAQVSREDIHRRITVEANVRGRDLLVS